MQKLLSPVSGDFVLALPKLETAASAFAAKHSEGHFAEPHVRALIEQARQSGRLPTVQSRPPAVFLGLSTQFYRPNKPPISRLCKLGRVFHGAAPLQNVSHLALAG